MRRSKAKLSEGSRAVEDERTSEAKWPQGAANATWRTDECRHEGRDPENTTPPITMRSENLA